MSLIKRVRDALQAAGHNLLAQELHDHLAGMASNINDLLKLHRKQGELVVELINRMRKDCRHTWWKQEPEIEWGISCASCGHVVQDERAVQWGERNVARRSVLHVHKNGRWFLLGKEIRDRLATQLVAKELKFESEVRQAPLPDTGAGTEGVATPSD